jgi:hypothetical protein
VRTSRPRRKHSCSRATATSWSARSRPTINPRPSHRLDGRLASQERLHPGEQLRTALDGGVPQADSTRSIVASAAAQDNRVPPKVRPVRARWPRHHLGPGRSGRPGAGRWPGPCRQDDVRLDAIVLDGPELPGAADPALHLVATRRMPCSSQSAPQAGQEALRRGHVAALALHGLDDDAATSSGLTRWRKSCVSSCSRPAIP